MPWRHLTSAGLIICLALSASAATQHRKRHPARPKAPAVQPQPITPQETPPAIPPTPEQGPSNPADVTLHGGQLTITARNSTLGDVLNAVRSKTGASVEMPPASNERVVGQFGPGAPRDVIAQLLNGSHYDYVLMGSPADPGALKKIVLTVRATGPEPVQQQANNQNPGYNPGIQPLQQGAQVEQELPTEDSTADAQQEPPPQPDQEEPQGVQPQQNGGPMVKTPEQLLRELQQQQQQQQNGQPAPQ